MNIRIYKAQINDLEPVCEIISELNTENYNFSKVEDMQKYIDKGLCYVAKDGDKIVGVLILEFDDANIQIKFIISKKKGVGKKLIEFTEKLAREKNIGKIWCWSLIRYDARGFYDKMGFTEQFLLKNQCYNEDCYIFGKMLSASNIP